MITHPEDHVTRAFASRFGGKPRVFAAPGRINIIGEHTDYSEGLVMPAAIDRRCTVAMAPNNSDIVRVLTLGREEEAEIAPGFTRAGSWVDYVAGVRASLSDAGIDVPGCDLVIHSDVPEGAGVSSSAALEVSVMTAMLACAGTASDPIDVARWAQAAENRYVGVPCGIMDQFVSANGIPGHALVLDCRSLAYDPAPLPEGAAFLVIDSAVRHQLTDGGYAARRADCEAAAQMLGIRVLRDATPELLQEIALPERIGRRAHHVVAENQRVRQTAEALCKGDLSEVGMLMNASHASLRDNFDVTCPETDVLADIAARTAGVFGARQMGGGFGGAVLALIDAAAVGAATETITAAYRARQGLAAPSFVCRIAGGACELAS